MPYYYTPPPVRVLDVIGGLRLAVWQHNNKNKTKSVVGGGGFHSFGDPINVSITQGPHL
jgi:hypothetical protein